jgi:cytochrome c oxidase cbb3-type subunit 4
MESIQITLHSIWTVLLFIVFIGIVAWAWSSKRKKAFDEAAHLPFDEEDEVKPQSKSGDQ